MNYLVASLDTVEALDLGVVLGVFYRGHKEGLIVKENIAEIAEVFFHIGI